MTTDVSANSFRLGSLETLGFQEEDVFACKLGDMNERMNALVQDVVVGHAQFQKDISASESRNFNFNWDGRVVTYQIGEGEWKELPIDDKIISRFQSTVADVWNLYNEKAPSVRKAVPISMASPEIQEGSKKINAVRSRILSGKSLDGSQKKHSITRSVGRRALGPLVDGFSLKKHVISIQSGDSGAAWLVYASPLVNFISGYLVERSGEKILNEAEGYEDAEGARDGHSLYLQGKLLKWSSVWMAGSVASEIAQNSLTGASASHAGVAASALGIAATPALLAYVTLATGYTGYNAYRCVKFRSRLNEKLTQGTEEAEKYLSALQYLEGLLVPKDEEIQKVIDDVKNDKSIPLEKEQGAIAGKLERLFITKVQYLKRRAGSKSVKEIIEKVPALTEKLRGDDVKVRTEGVGESKKLIRMIKEQNSYKTDIYTVLCIASLIGLVALILSIPYGMILPVLILGIISASLSVGVSGFILGQFLWFIIKHWNDKSEDVSEMEHQAMVAKAVL